MLCENIEIKIRKKELIEKIKEDIKENEWRLRIILTTPGHRDMYATLSSMKRTLKLLHYIKNLMEFCDKYNIKYKIYTANYEPDVLLETAEEDDVAFYLFIDPEFKSFDDVIRKQKEYIKVQEEYIKDLEKKVKVKLHDLALISIS